MKSDLDKHIEKLRKKETFRLYYDRAEAKRRIAQEITTLRKTYNLTQTELAERMHTKQQVVSRLENPADRRIPSFDLLERVASAFNKKLIIAIE